ncbi:MAG: integral rane sensor signal transduction histidine kinase [Eubacterium sp.]|jgi:signal transduction histidine kinase|nr:integral rane sensor signal transduction histidine kinase [Eubacterium sp.]
MKRNTIKWRIFKYNIIIIIVLIILTTVVFNIAIHLYIESDVTKQLDNIALRAEDTALHRGPDFFSPIDNKNPLNGQNLPPPPKVQDNKSQNSNELFRFYYMLDRSLREPLSILNADYILFDKSKRIIPPLEGDYFKPSNDILDKITNELKIINNTRIKQYMDFTLSGTKYVAIARPVYDKNSFGLGWIIVYSSVKKLNQLQWGINAILLVILILSAGITALFSSISAKKISAPFSSLNKHIGNIAERNFDTKINMQVDDELQELVNKINTMSQKLETYDKAQKTFLQNASHEFRTPLMSIRSYAEGIKYNVVEHEAASNIIIDETKRMTQLVENLLYLSRLDAIEENYSFRSLEFNNFMNCCVERMNGIAKTDNIQIVYNTVSEEVEICADEEKLSRAVTNIIGNCIRYAETSVEISTEKIADNKLEIAIKDDGPGIDDNELPNIFERFYKGKKGNFGLGLAISNNIIERHNGKIIAENTEAGALFRLILPIK